MIYTVLDIETSGFDRHGDDILQFAYLQLDENMEFIRSNSFYLWEEGFRWQKSAFDVHGIGMETLKKVTVEDMRRNYREMYVVLSRGNLVGHNIEAFDAPFCQSFMRRHSIIPDTPSSIHDTMKFGQQAFRKKLKLKVLAEQLGINDSTIHALSQAWFSNVAQAHDASYDVTMTALCYFQLRSLGYGLS